MIAMAMPQSHPIEGALERAQFDGLRPNLGRTIRFAGHRPGDVLELQVLDALTGRMRSAQVAHADAFAMAVHLATKAEKFDCSGVFVIGNRLDPAVATRAGCGQWITQLKGSSTTDRDVTARMLLFVDFDAKRPKGTSSTDAQVQATAHVATQVYDRFVAILEGDDAIAYGHSGNGRSLFVALDGIEEVKAGPLIRGALAAVKALHETEHVEIDVSVSDAKRLIPCFGTTKRKGISNNPDRPHRRTGLVCGANIRRLGLAELEALVTTLREACDERGRGEVDKAMGIKARPSPLPSTVSSTPRASDSPFDRAKAIPIADVLAWQGLFDGDRPVCPGCGISDGSSVAIVGNGVKCSHARCATKGFARGFRTTIDVVCESRNVTAQEAVALMADHFGFEGFASRARLRTVAPAARDADAAFVRGDHVELAHSLVAELQKTGEVVFAEGRLFQYGDASGVWESVTPDVESRIVQGFAGEHVASKPKPLAIRLSDVQGATKLAHDVVARPDFFNGAPTGLVFTNGFVQVSGDGIRILPHTKEQRARSAYPFTFDQNAPVGRFTGFLGDLFRDDADANEKIALLQEFFGACVLGAATIYQTSLVAVGDGANGKSTFIEVMRESMPAGSTSAIPPQDWNQEYRRALIASKRLNVVSELPEADILASESFKAIVTGDAIVGRPIREAPFVFNPIAGHMFAANRLPGASDLTEGFWRRFLVLRFNRVFRGDDAKTNLAQELLAAERPGIVGWMLDGAARLFRQGRYTVSPSSIAEREEWRRQANPVALFLSECTRDLREGENGTRSMQLYTLFRTWADRNGHRPMSSTKFGMRMRELGKGADKGREGNRYPVVVVTQEAI